MDRESEAPSVRSTATRAGSGDSVIKPLSMAMPVPVEKPSPFALRAWTVRVTEKPSGLIDCAGASQVKVPSVSFSILMWTYPTSTSHPPQKVRYRLVFLLDL
jgi:hypothetical protein